MTTEQNDEYPTCEKCGEQHRWSWCPRDIPHASTQPVYRCRRDGLTTAGFCSDWTHDPATEEETEEYRNRWWPDRPRTARGDG